MERANTEQANTEPWLLGSIPGYDPVISHLLRASQHIQQDVDHWFGSLPADQIWATPAGFHLKHLAGSTGRLCTYLSGGTLSAVQLAEIPREQEASGDLVPAIHRAFAQYEAFVKELAPRQFGDLRYIGRRGIPVTAISLAIHIVEHGQRHLGQAITALKSSGRP